MTTGTKVEAVALWVPNGHTLRDGSWEDGPGDLVRIDEASDFQKLHGFPLVPASAITALEGEVAMLRDALHIETHKVITCGVAASHPDASLSRRMEYSGKWDSPQAHQVRALRDKADTAERRVADLEKLLASARRAIGDHHAPNDCYATGPLTGDQFLDLVQCPACAFLDQYAALTKETP